MALQTTYPADFALGFEGQLADGGHDRFSETKVASTSADYFFGRAVMLDVTDETQFIIPAGAGTFAGITHRTHSVELDTLPAGTEEGIPDTKPANILRKGRIIVFPEDAVAPGDTVFFRHSNAGADPEGNGRFRSDNDGGSGDVQQVSTGARWVTAAAAGEAAILEINLPA